MFIEENATGILDELDRLRTVNAKLLEEFEYIVEMLAEGGMPSGSDITNARAAIKEARK